MRIAPHPSPRVEAAAARHRVRTGTPFLLARVLALFVMLFASAAFAAPAKVVSFRADSANGTGHYAVPGNAGPWVDLTGHGHDAALESFVGNAASGWLGAGTHASPYRLYFDDGPQRVV